MRLLPFYELPFEKWYRKLSCSTFWIKHSFLPFHWSHSNYGSMRNFFDHSSLKTCFRFYFFIYLKSLYARHKNIVIFWKFLREVIKLKMSIKRYKNRKINADFIFSLRNSNQTWDIIFFFLYEMINIILIEYIQSIKRY